MSTEQPEEDDSTDRLLSEYGELYLLLDVDPQVLHEAIFSCEPSQLRQIMQVMENNLNDYHYHTPSDLGTAQQFLSVWFIALRAWDSKSTPDEKNQITDLDHETLIYDQHWD